MITAILIRTTKSPFPLELLAFLGFLIGIRLFVYGFKLLQRRRLILDTPCSKVRSASMGMVEINGLAEGPYTMIAPITARECYYFRTAVWEFKQQGKNKQWVKVAGECMHVPFFVDDNTGRMLIDPRGADLDLHRDFQQEFNTSIFSSRNDAPANVVSFLARHGVATSNKIKVEEFCIKPKNSLFILGTLAENPGIAVIPEPVHDAEPVYSFTPQGFSLNISVSREFQTGSPAVQQIVEYQTQARHGIELVTNPGSPEASAAAQQRVEAAMLKAGISNPAAWAAAGISAGGGTGVQVMKDPGFGTASNAADSTGIAGIAGNGFDLHPPVVLMKGTNNKTFLISWRSQKEVASFLGWKCTLMIWGGPPLALLSLYVLLSTLKLL